MVLVQTLSRADNQWHESASYNNPNAGYFQGLDIQTARTGWSQLTAFATQMQVVASGVTVQPPMVHLSAATTAPV